MIDAFVRNNGLRAGDAVIVKKEPFRILNHYVIYLGSYYGRHKFVANYTQGVRILEEEDMYKFGEYMTPTRIKRFLGNEVQRNTAVQRALNRVDEQSYNLLLNNCEHYSNYVQTGKPYSGQTKLFGAGLTAAGLISAANSENENNQKAGLIVAGLGLLTLLFDD